MTGAAHLGGGGSAIKRAVVAVGAVFVAMVSMLGADAGAFRLTLVGAASTAHSRSATRWSAPADAVDTLPAQSVPDSVIDLGARVEPAPTRFAGRGRTASSNPVATTAGAASAAAAPAAPAPLSGGAWAVVVGIDEYGELPDLVSAGADASDMASVLSHSGVPSSHVRYLRDGSATAGAIESALAWLSSSSEADSTIVFFFAGHVIDLGGGTEAVVAADGVTVSDRRVAQLLAPSPAGKAWVVIAGCYGGGFTEVLRPGRVLTAAAPAGALAYENDAYGRSYLAEFVLRRGLLEGKAGTTVVQEVVAWAQGQLGALHPNRLLSQDDWSTEPITVSGIPETVGPPRPGPAPTPSPSPSPVAQCPIYAICITARSSD